MAADFSNLQTEMTLIGAIAVITLLTLFLYHMSLRLGRVLDMQTATMDVLKTISHSAVDLDVLLQSLVETAARLYSADAVAIVRPSDEGANYVACTGFPEDYYQYLCQVDFASAENALIQRVLLNNEPIRIANTTIDPLWWNSAERKCFRSWLCVPLMRDDGAIGLIVLARTSTKVILLGGRAGNVTGHTIWGRDIPFNDREVEGITIFSNGAVIAIENARLFEAEQERTSELQGSLEYQTATSEVLDVISRSPSEIQPVLDTIVDTAQRLCQSDRAQFYGLKSDGRYHLQAEVGTHPEFRAYLLNNPIVPSHSLGSTTAQAALEGRTLNVADVAAEERYSHGEFHRLGRGRSALAVPLRRKEQVIGIITVARNTVRPFNEREVSLIETFANQAVIAINNVTLFEEVQESLAYQTATSEVLSVISRSPHNLQPVLDVIVETSVRLCRSTYGHVRLLQDDGAYHIAAHKIDDPELVVQMRANPFYPGQDSISGRAALEGRTVHVVDVAADPLVSGFQRQISDKVRTAMAVPLKRNDKVIGLISVFHDHVRPFTDRQIKLVETFADQAVIAINNVALFEEVQARTKELARSLEELTALGEVGRSVSSTLDLAHVLQTILKNAVRMAIAGGGTIYVYSNETEDFRLAASLNMSEEHIARVRAQPLSMSDPIVGDCARQRQAVQIEDLAREDVQSSPLLGLLARAGVRSIMAVPLLRQNEVIGALVIRREAPGRFKPEIVRLLDAFAAQSAIAVNNARLFEEVARKSVELEIASKHKSQFVANMSHELRTPLAAMLGYTELLVDGLLGELPEKAITTLTRVQSNGKHLLGLINAVLDISKIEAGQFSLDLGEYAVSNLVETVRVATESLASGKGIVLQTEVKPDLPHGFGDEPRLTQVLLNLVGNAIKFTDQGKVTVTARADDDAFAIAVRDTGPGIPPAEQARIFEEFHQVDSSDTRVKGGTGLGLAIAKRIVNLHGGRIWVESELGAGATFHIMLPVRTTAQGAAA